MGAERRAPETRPQLIFESSYGVTIQYGDTRTTELELLRGFFEDNLWHGDSPYRLDCRRVDVEMPMLTLDDFVKGEERG